MSTVIVQTIEGKIFRSNVFMLDGSSNIVEMFSPSVYNYYTQKYEPKKYAGMTLKISFNTVREMTIIPENKKKSLNSEE